MIRVIHGKVVDHQFITEEPIPNFGPSADLIVYVPPAKENAVAPASMFELFGKSPVLRSAEDIDRQIRQERQSWNDR
jgi:hypothetical protein